MISPSLTFTLFQKSEVSSVKYMFWNDYKHILKEGDDQYVPYDTTGQYSQLFAIPEQRYIFHVHS